MKTQRMESLRDLFLHEMQDLRDAEDQMTEVLPRMADAAKAAPLRRALEESVEHTERHRRTLDEILERMDAGSDHVVCQGMRGLVVEASKLMKRRDMEDEVLDAALIAATQKIEHYTIAGYGTLRSYAELLGDDEARDALSRILEEESEMDGRLTQVAGETVNEAARA
jgi:ferritin-like metal-binding protein YciE